MPCGRRDRQESVKCVGQLLGDMLEAACWGTSYFGDHLLRWACGGSHLGSLQQKPLPVCPCFLLLSSMYIQLLPSLTMLASFLFVGPPGFLGGELSCDLSSELLWLANAPSQTDT